MRQVVGVAFSIVIGAVTAAGYAARPAVLTVDVDKPGIAISPMLNGLMTEEINHSYDGGLYAELIQNRSFLDSETDPLHWSIVGNAALAVMALDRHDPMNAASPVSLRVDLHVGATPVGVGNDGFWGIPLKPDTVYSVSFYAKSGNGFTGPLRVTLVTNSGALAAPAVQTASITEGWKQYQLTLRTGPDIKPSSGNKFVISSPAGATGSFFLSLVSLFPPTYQDHPNGLRPDLMKLMAELHPTFLRMPGGNYLEGDTFATRFDWRKMIGPVDQRAGHTGCWGYRSSDGFGLAEYLTWCEELKMEPLLAVFAGYTLKHDFVSAGPNLEPFVKEALQEIEYVTGGAETEWGKRRAEDGHLTPFTLHYVEIGNEDEFDRSGSYDGRFAQFYDAIKAKYPKLQIIATTAVKSRRPDVYDDHFYRSPKAMASDGHHYDKVDRSGPKIFVGEWASQEGKPTPDLNAGLGDASWLMGLERNSDVVVMQSYAPLLANVNPKAWQWGTNLIGYDALNSFGSPSYYAQFMLNQNRGDVVLPANITLQSQSPAMIPVARGGIGVGTWQTAAEFKDVVVTHDDQTLLTTKFSGDTKAWKINAGQWNMQESALRQTNEKAQTWATIGDPAWTDYTLSLKARKISGDEGFLILFHATDPDNHVWWNIGGWGNTRSQIESDYDGEKQSLGQSMKMTVDTGRWYDIKIEMKGRTINCYLDGKLITSAIDNLPNSKAPVFATATYDKSPGEVILKVVNMSADTVDAAIDLRGAKDVAPSARSIVLAGDSAKATNTIDHPTDLIPQEFPIKDAALKFQHPFPPYSLSIMRLKAAPQ